MFASLRAGPEIRSRPQDRARDTSAHRDRVPRVPRRRGGSPSGRAPARWTRAPGVERPPPTEWATHPSKRAIRRTSPTDVTELLDLDGAGTPKPYLAEPENRLRASRQASRAAMLGATRAKRSRNPTRYRVEVRSSSSSASPKSPTTSDPVARRPWTSSLTDRRRVFIQAACDASATDSSGKSARNRRDLGRPD